MDHQLVSTSLISSCQSPYRTGRRCIMPFMPEETYMPLSLCNAERAHCLRTE